MAADLAIKEPARAATTGNITLSGLQTIDGVALSANDRVLVRAQTTVTHNGIYTAASGGWTRATDFDGAGEVTGGTQVYVQQGNALGDIAWRVAGDSPVTPGTHSIAFEPEFTQGGTGAIARALQSKARERISVLDYGAKGDGTTDDSAAIQAAIDANKGKTIVLPSGYTFRAAGISLSGSTYDGSAIVIEGTFLLKPSGGGTNGPLGNAWLGIVLHDVEDVFIDVPGMMDGNRTDQADHQQHHLLALFGARRVRIAHFNAREVRGDGIVITSKTNGDPLTINSRDVVIGQIRVINSADDGRNALSIVSGENILVAGGLSINVGGRDVGNLIMPGGFDIEPDGDWHLVRNVRSGPWHVETVGSSGIAVLGVAITNDTTRDWNVEDVSIAPSIVIHNGSQDEAGGPLFIRCRRVTAEVTLIRSARTAGMEIDNADWCDIRARVTGCAQSLTVGYAGSLCDSNVHVEIEDYSIYGLAVVGADRCRFTGQVKAPTTGSANGVMLTVASRGSLTQTGNVYSVDVPKAGGNVFAFHTGASLTLTECVVADCAFSGYSDYGSQFGFLTFIPTRNVQGRNFATAIPTDGYWALGDYVQNVNPSIGSGKVLLGWSRLTSGSSHTPGTDWTPVYATTS